MLQRLAPRKKRGFSFGVKTLYQIRHLTGNLLVVVKMMGAALNLLVGENLVMFVEETLQRMENFKIFAPRRMGEKILFEPKRGFA